MSQHQLRADKNCLNCKQAVEKRFCSNCGQENSDTRKTFHHLFLHFFEDLTHYENAFWRTIKNLLFKPAALTKEYLSGKRLSYLAPIRLYLFISFVTFLTISVFPEEAESENDKLKITFEEAKEEKSASVKKIFTLQKKGVFSKKEADSLAAYTKRAENENGVTGDFHFGKRNFKNVNELDSIQKFGNTKDKLSPLSYWCIRKIIKAAQNINSTDFEKQFSDSVFRNLPKVLFVYMPIFAFILWLFHSKKRWYYFDHGIFTLHYFSFLLLLFWLLFLVDNLVLYSTNEIITSISKVMYAAGFIWMFYYFFASHYRFYQETRLISSLKSTVMFGINMFLILILLILFLFYTLINLA